MNAYKVKFFFKDSSGVLLHTSVEYVEADVYEQACEEAREVCESMCAQDFEVENTENK